jgi:hypothetical protein
MNNEPVGYYYSHACFDIRDCSEQMKRNGVPLYIYPVKELTDEEIMAITEPMFVLGDKKMICDFARAILRKAQEK